MARILVIDDDRSLREVVGFMLAEAGHEVLEAEDGESGLERLAELPDLVLTDVRMPGIDGLEVLRRVSEADAEAAPPVVVITAHGTVEQAVAAMRMGAFTYLLKPFARDELRLTVDQALHTRELELENARLRARLRLREADHGLVHRDAAMTTLLAELGRIAPSDASLLIIGESGTGKELVARACHDLSPRRERPFVVVNCGALPAELMESELFGHERGAFTGADRARPGRVRAAEGGTLFLDEIGELPAALQPKLLRALEAREVTPVGGAPVPVDFRLVCATNRDLAADVAEGRFRTDLYHRIAVVPLTVPPLRERPDDIPLLWAHFTRRHAGRDLDSEPALLAELARRPWPGNVRELKNLNERMVLLRGGEILAAADLERCAAPPSAPADAGRAAGPEDAPPLPLGAFPDEGFSLPELEKEVVRRALAICGGNRTRAAAYLGVPRHVIVYRIAKYGLD